MTHQGLCSSSELATCWYFIHADADEQSVQGVPARYMFTQECLRGEKPCMGSSRQHSCISQRYAFVGRFGVGRQCRNLPNPPKARGCKAALNPTQADLSAGYFARKPLIRFADSRARNVHHTSRHQPSMSCATAKAGMFHFLHPCIPWALHLIVFRLPGGIGGSFLRVLPTISTCHVSGCQLCVCVCIRIPKNSHTRWPHASYASGPGRHGSAFSHFPLGCARVQICSGPRSMFARETLDLHRVFVERGCCVTKMGWLRV